ncbi:hypothetical protein SBA3_4220013 [Candidatus Sulfopaludibacter sp. SbA3]|nr:hypothetical protein SBA3_4220013 [Candidatus Sulfopaludibacter sp. SbA3]
MVGATTCYFALGLYFVVTFAIRETEGPQQMALPDLHVGFVAVFPNSRPHVFNRQTA